MKKIKKKNLKGFTLVELIVVIAIIGVLAAILIPTMMGRVKDAKQKTANDAAAKIGEQAAIIAADMEAAGTLMQFSNLRCGFCAADPTIVYLNATFGNNEEPKDTKADAAAGHKYFRYEMEKAIPELTSATWAVAFNEDCSIKGVIYKSNDSKYVGTYPVNDAVRENVERTPIKASNFETAMAVFNLGGSN